MLVSPTSSHELPQFCWASKVYPVEVGAAILDCDMLHNCQRALKLFVGGLSGAYFP